MVSERTDLPVTDEEARLTYRERYLDFFPKQCLAGRRIGLYEHSSVARGLLGEILAEQGRAGITPGQAQEILAKRKASQPPPADANAR